MQMPNPRFNRQDSMASGSSTPTGVWDYASANPGGLDKHDLYPAWSELRGELPLSKEEIEDIFFDVGCCAKSIRYIDCHGSHAPSSPPSCKIRSVSRPPRQETCLISSWSS